MEALSYQNTDGPGAPATRAEYEERRLAEILNGEPLPEECHVFWGWEGHVPYAGEGPEPVFTRPGQVGTVTYKAENGVMVPSIEWEDVKEVNQEWERHWRSLPA